MNFIDETVQTFYCYYNAGNNSNIRMKQILQVCKPATEKFIFSRVYFQLYDLYSKRYEKDNILFLERQRQINEKYSYKDIMEYLEVINLK